MRQTNTPKPDFSTPINFLFYLITTYPETLDDSPGRLQQIMEASTFLFEIRDADAVQQQFVNIATQGWKALPAEDRPLEAWFSSNIITDLERIYKQNPPTAKISKEDIKQFLQTQDISFFKIMPLTTFINILNSFNAQIGIADAPIAIPAETLKKEAENKLKACASTEIQEEFAKAIDDKTKTQKIINTLLTQYNITIGLKPSSTLADVSYKKISETDEDTLKAWFTADSLALYSAIMLAIKPAPLRRPETPQQPRPKTPQQPRPETPPPTTQSLSEFITNHFDPSNDMHSLIKHEIKKLSYISTGDSDQDIIKKLWKNRDTLKSTIKSSIITSIIFDRLGTGVTVETLANIDKISLMENFFSLTEEELKRYITSPTEEKPAMHSAGHQPHLWSGANNPDQTQHDGATNPTKNDFK